MKNVVFFAAVSCLFNAQLQLVAMKLSYVLGIVFIGFLAWEYLLYFPIFTAYLLHVILLCYIWSQNTAFTMKNSQKLCYTKKKVMKSMAKKKLATFSANVINVACKYDILKCFDMWKLIGQR